MGLQCVYCGSMMGFEQISLLMQTSLKAITSPYLEETQRELRAALENAQHIVLMGYSLPKDDYLSQCTGCSIAKSARTQQQETALRITDWL